MAATRVILSTTNEKPISFHYKAALIIRLLAVAYGALHDDYFRVPFTDTDYEVFSSSAKLVTERRSPYEQPEYRYSPLIAYLLTPNVYLSQYFGKVLFSLFDVSIGFVIYQLVLHIYGVERKAKQCAIIWLYNVLPIIIAARGNSDSLSALLILLTLYAHLRQEYHLSGMLLGLCTHLRFYPVVFFAPFFLTVGDRKFFGFFNWLVSPLNSKLLFVAAFLSVFTSSTALFHYLYGDDFLEQTMFYHINRLDIRHNFSVYFYSLYLESSHFYDVFNFIGKRLSLLAAQATLILFFSFKYSRLRHLAFSMFCIAFSFVAFNKVVTSQYIIWYLSLLPLFLPSITLSRKKVLTLTGLWIFGQLVWLASAYALEFEGYNTFLCIWASSILVLVINIYILKTFINRYNSEEQVDRISATDDIRKYQ